MAKKKKKNTKKVNKELDKLLKEKHNIEDVSVLDKKETPKSSPKKTNSKTNSNRTSSSKKKNDI